MSEQTRDQDAVVIERTFDAPIELVWAMWTDPVHVAAWYGPDGASIPRADLDVRVGGTRLVAMEMAGPDGPMRMWFTGEYRVVEEPTRLVYTEAMADAEGRVLEPSELGMPDGHPVLTEVTVELRDLDGATAMIMTHAGVPSDSPGAAGWTMAIDKLAIHLAASA